MIVPRGEQEPVCYTDFVKVQQSSEARPQQTGVKKVVGRKKAVVEGEEGEGGVSRRKSKNAPENMPVIPVSVDGEVREEVMEGQEKKVSSRNGVASKGTSTTSSKRGVASGAKRGTVAAGKRRSVATKKSTTGTVKRGTTASTRSTTSAAKRSSITRKSGEGKGKVKPEKGKSGEEEKTVAVEKTGEKASARKKSGIKAGK